MIELIAEYIYIYQDCESLYFIPTYNFRHDALLPRSLNTVQGILMKKTRWPVSTLNSQRVQT